MKYAVTLNQGYIFYDGFYPKGYICHLHNDFETACYNIDDNPIFNVHLLTDDYRMGDILDSFEYVDYNHRYVESAYKFYTDIRGSNNLVALDMDEWFKVNYE